MSTSKPAWPTPAIGKSRRRGTCRLDAYSGVYIAKLMRDDGEDGESQIIFVVRDDEGASDMLFQTSDTTWQAYNY